MPASRPARKKKDASFDPQHLLIRLQVTLRADAQAIAPVVDGIMHMVSHLKCDCGEDVEIQTALFEALTNAIVHGCKGDMSRLVECFVACDEKGGIVIVVRDPGVGFDPDSVPSPLEAENLLQRRGRGIYLINQLMDEVRFERGGSEIRMKKFRRS